MPLDGRARGTGVRDGSTLEPLGVLVLAGEDDGPEAGDAVVAVRALGVVLVPDGHPDGDLVVDVEAEIAPLVAGQAADLVLAAGQADGGAAAV